MAFHNNTAKNLKEKDVHNNTYKLRNNIFFRLGSAFREWKCDSRGIQQTRNSLLK